MVNKKLESCIMGRFCTVIYIILHFIAIGLFIYSSIIFNEHYYIDHYPGLNKDL